MRTEVKDLNPEIVATIVSIIPCRIEANNPTIHPGNFIIPASQDSIPSILHVKEAGHDVYMGCERNPRYMRIKLPPYEVARGIIEQFVGSVIATQDNAQPGIFYVPGKYESNEIEVRFPEELMKAKVQQKNWFLELVKMADDDWQKSNHRHSAISNLQRDAATFLGFKREWVDAIKSNPELLNLVPCKFCTFIINKAAIVCPNCKNILDKEKFEFTNAS